MRKRFSVARQLRQDSQRECTPGNRRAAVTSSPICSGVPKAISGSGFNVLGIANHGKPS
jgi:hypothetical protein